MSSLPLKLSGRALIVNAGNHVLVLRRSPRAKWFAGLWEFPGGKGEPEEPFEVALRREIAEETGLIVELGRVLGAGEHVIRDLRVAFLFVEARPRNHAALVRLSEEHDEFAWVAPEKLPEHEMAPPFRAIASAYARRAC